MNRKCLTLYSRANGRFVSRDGSEMARKLREMMAEAPDDASRQEIQRLAERMEQM